MSQKAFASALRKAGLQDVTIHDLRRTFGTDCSRSRIEPKRLQGWMGHRSIETTMKYYVVVNQDYELEAIRRLDGRMDTHMDTSKNRELQETPQPFDLIGEPCKIRTCDPLIKSYIYINSFTCQILSKPRKYLPLNTIKGIRSAHFKHIFSDMNCTIAAHGSDQK
jgi:hypothetical protein